MQSGELRTICKRDAWSRCVDTCLPVLQVVEALHGLVPRLSPDQQRDYEAVTELFGSTRMLLAVLEQQQLAQVISGLQCDFYDVLEPVRAVRPSRGGAGFDVDVINSLRLLHFQIDPSQ